jgi:hypothetical protein
MIFATQLHHSQDLFSLFPFLHVWQSASFSISGAVYGKRQGRTEHIPLSMIYGFPFSFLASIPLSMDISLFSSSFLLDDLTRQRQ